MFSKLTQICILVFELVSAYGTVGLSLGVPYVSRIFPHQVSLSHVARQANYSFSGALRPLSKLIICVVMLRGRHRGLPVAIDRAVILPFEFRNNDNFDHHDQDNGNSFRRTATGLSHRSSHRGPLSEKRSSHNLQQRTRRSSSIDSANGRKSSDGQA